MFMLIQRVAGMHIAYALLILGMVVPGRTMASTSDSHSAQASADSVHCAKMQVVDYSDHDETVLRLRKLYQAGRFAELDGALTCLMLQTQRFQSGKPGASAVYWMFRRQMPAPGVNPDDSLHVQRWRRERPSSIYAQFAELRLMYAMAWNERGSDYARNVPEEGWKRFRQGLLNAEQEILNAPEQLRNTPIWQNLLLAVVQDARGIENGAEAVFEEGVRRWPGYYDFYEVFLTRLVPKWGGSWEAVDQFINYWSANRQSSEGNSLYARLYMSVIRSGVNPYETKISWQQMKASLEDLVARYPDASHMNVAASYACGYRDVAYLNVTLKRIRPVDMNPSAWLRGTDPEACMQWLKSQNG
jgi:hypothetical protein